MDNRALERPFILEPSPMLTRRSLSRAQHAWSTVVLPDFLVPSLSYQHFQPLQIRSSSKSVPRQRGLLDEYLKPKKPVRPGRKRGQVFSVDNEPLPQPVLDPKKRSKSEVDPNHGLYGFFNGERDALVTPKDDVAHGEEDLWKNCVLTQSANRSS